MMYEITHATPLLFTPRYSILMNELWGRSTYLLAADIGTGPALVTCMHCTVLLLDCIVLHSIVRLMMSRIKVVSADGNKM